MIHAIIESRQALEGAGVRLRRAFGGKDAAALFDPFLLLDDFGSRYPHEYLAGFPWHPHRGIQTVTYLIKGEVHHEDSIGTKGEIGPGDLQWMSAGSGIFHVEMPKPLMRPGERGPQDPEVRGYQLWINLPSQYKMSDPEYRNLQDEATPRVVLDDGSEVSIIAGEVKHIPGVGNLKGPVCEPYSDIKYLDVRMKDNSDLEFSVKDGYTDFVYVVEGEGTFADSNSAIASKNVILFTREGDTIRVRTGHHPLRFLLLSGKPIGEPVAWYGPIVMNTEQQILRALEELRNGSFIKRKATSFDYFKY